MELKAITEPPNNYLIEIDLNGAVRQCGFSTIVACASLLAIVVFGRRWIEGRMSSEENAAKMYVSVVVLLLSLSMGVLAYTVRNPCRTQQGYYIGCGVNEDQTTGFFLAIGIAILGLTLATLYSLNAGWLIAAYGYYYVDYMVQFGHQASPLTRTTTFIIPALALASIGAAHYAHSITSMLKARKLVSQPS
ncbi:MAG: hypothetical protein PVI21_01920 [Candidatus Woesebacteria bacterium]|jgi:hypothetical protein